jgi:hypothetical protein
MLLQDLPFLKDVSCSHLAFELELYALPWLDHGDLVSMRHVKSLGVT